MSGGRPTSYDPKYCQMLIDHMDRGLSFEAFAGAIGVCKDTLYEWAKVHPPFSDAKRIGTAKSLLWWEEEGQKGLWDETEYNEETGKPRSKRSLNASVWIFNMKNRHRWRDKQEIEASGFNERADALRKMSLQELRDHVKKLDGEVK